MFRSSLALGSPHYATSWLPLGSRARGSTLEGGLIVESPSWCPSLSFIRGPAVVYPSLLSLLLQSIYLGNVPIFLPLSSSPPTRWAVCTVYIFCLFCFMGPFHLQHLSCLYSLVYLYPLAVPSLPFPFNLPYQSYLPSLSALSSCNYLVIHVVKLPSPSGSVLSLHLDLLRALLLYPYPLLPALEQ